MLPDGVGSSSALLGRSNVQPRAMLQVDGRTSTLLPVPESSPPNPPGLVARRSQAKVIVYNHKLAPGQWLGTVGTVFEGISVEAWVKRRVGSFSYGYCELLTESMLYRCAREARHPGEGKGTHKDALTA